MPVSSYVVAYGASQAFTFAPLRPDTAEEIDAYGASQVVVNVNNSYYATVYPTTVALNLAPGAAVTAAFQVQGSNVLNVGGGDASVLTDNAANALSGTHAVIQPAVSGTGSFTGVSKTWGATPRVGVFGGRSVRPAPRP